MTTEIVVHPSPAVLAAATAARLITVLTDVQGRGRVPAVVLTGGGSGTEVLAQTAASPAGAAVDWSRVEIYWGDERFVAADDDDRNEKGARAALLDHVGVDAARVHAMPSSDGEFGDDIDAAAQAYADILEGVDGFDVLMLGMGPEGHVASIFPDSPAVHDTRPVVAVRNCPKPPPTRISLTLPMIRTASEVWLIVAGEGKAEAVAAAIGGASEVDIPAAGAIGREHTRWLLDTGAASRLDRPSP